MSANLKATKIVIEYADRTVTLNSNQAEKVMQHVRTLPGVMKLNWKKKMKEEKIFYSEFVQMKPKEYKKLIEVYGRVKTGEAIFTLDLSIPNQIRKPYKDHYRAILSWVMSTIGAVPLRGKSPNSSTKHVNKNDNRLPEPPPPEMPSKEALEKAKRFKEMSDNKNRTNKSQTIGDILTQLKPGG